MNFQYFGTKQFFMFKTSLLLLNFCLCVYVTGNKRNQGFHVIPKQFRDYVLFLAILGITCNPQNIRYYT